MASKSRSVLLGGTRVPLRRVEIEAQVKGSLMGLQSTFYYYCLESKTRSNTRSKARSKAGSKASSNPVEVRFRFPVDESMAVVGLEAELDGRHIKATLMEKDKAETEYDDAIASGMTASMGKEESGDIFSIALGNLTPKTEAKVVLTMVGELPMEEDSGAVRFSLPAVLKQRYIPVGGAIVQSPAAEPQRQQNMSGQVSAASSFLLRVYDSQDVSSISSPTHEIVTKDTEQLMEVGMKDDASLSNDLVILIDHKNPHLPKAIIEPGREGANDLMSCPAVMLSFFPEFSSAEAASELVFLVDRSGSMHGNFISSARETLILFLKSIPTGCHFNIIGFGSSYSSLFPKSVPYTQSNLDKAIMYAGSMLANFGGTELLAPLQYIFQQAYLPSLPRQVFVLTDGAVFNVREIMDEVKAHVDNARVFAFGIGSGASTALVKGLARAGRGSYEFVAEGERLQPKVIRVLKKALQPALTRIEIKLAPQSLEFVQSPCVIPPIFKGERLVIYGFLKNKSSCQRSATCTLQGQFLGELVQHQIDFSFDTAPSSGFELPIVHQLAAKRLLKDWEDGKGLACLSSKQKKTKAVELSIKSGVVCASTAFIAINEEEQKPIKGAIVVWDLQASEPASCLHTSYLPQFGTAIRHSRKRLAGSSPGKQLATKAARKSAPAIRRGVKSSPKKKSVAKKRAQPVARTTKGKRVLKHKKPQSTTRRATAMGVNILEMEIDSNSPARNADKLSALSGLISLQTANGYWELDQSLAKTLKCKLPGLQKACPTTGSIWATLLALVTLEKQFGASKDEWELIAMKAEQWLKKQCIPNLKDFRSAAQKYLA